MKYLVALLTLLPVAALAQSHLPPAPDPIVTAYQLGMGAGQALEAMDAKLKWVLDNWVSKSPEEAKK